MMKLLRSLFSPKVDARAAAYRKMAVILRYTLSRELKDESCNIREFFNRLFAVREELRAVAIANSDEFIDVSGNDRLIGVIDRIDTFTAKWHFAYMAWYDGYRPHFVKERAKEPITEFAYMDMQTLFPCIRDLQNDSEELLDEIGAAIQHFGG